MPDYCDDIIGAAFDEFDAAERSAGPAAPGAHAVRRKVALQRRIRLAGVAVAATLFLAVPAAIHAAFPWGDNSPPTGSGPAGSATASPGGTANPSASPSAPGPAASPPDVRNATLDLPPFPGWEKSCKAEGAHTFVNGIVTTARNTQLVIGAPATILADLDGMPGNEVLTTIRCQNHGSVHVTQLLALKVAAGGTLTTMGYVVNSPDTPNVTADFSQKSIVVDNGVVKLTVYGAYQTNGWPPCDRQVRSYAWRNGEFRQVSGPTTFVKPSADFHRVDFGNAGLLLNFRDPGGGGGLTTCVTMVNGVGEATVPNSTVHYTVTAGPVSFARATDGEAAFAVFTLETADGTTTQTLRSFTHGADYPLGWEVLRSGTNGVTAIEKAEAAAGVVRVTVMTAGGRQVWTYRPSAVDRSWQRLN